MSDLPYSRDVLRLAADAIGAGRLEAPDGTGTETNPACGDRSTVDVELQEDRIVAMAHDTKACVLAQASASILGAALPGHTVGELTTLRTAVAAMLAGNAPPAAPFATYATLADVALHPGRHRCVLLPIDAALKASQTGEPGGQRADNQGAGGQ
jgi:nitrogen fixation protein NifU and related proteins